jgi:putative phosphoribosyl transferase
MMKVHVSPHYVPLPLANRAEAGRLLAAELHDYRNRRDVIVLGLPRGGVPVAYQVAQSLGAPLDVLLVRKLGVPGHEELAFGAIAGGGVRVLDQELIEELSIRPDAIERVTAAEQSVLEERDRAYRHDRPPLDVRGRVVLIVDDGIATGSTMRAGIQALRRQEPAELAAVAPVASVQASSLLRPEADELVCLARPEPFHAVGFWYVDFAPVSDDEVRRLLGASVRPHPAGAEAARPLAKPPACTKSDFR